MKILIFTLSLTLLASCGKKPTTEKSKSLQKDSVEWESSAYEIPKVGFHKAIALNYHLEWLHEFMTVNPNGNKPVLGDRPFLLEISEDDAVEIRFYSDHYLKSVSYMDLGNKFDSTKIANLNVNKMTALTNMADFYRSFTYGQPNIDSPEQDMLNKVFIIETEEADGPYKSTMKMMIWMECHGGLKFKSKNDYTCGKNAMKFNYKLIDYKLQKDL